MVRPIPNYWESGLTGKVRYRQGFRGRLILQVEVRYEKRLRFRACGTAYGWRDATVVDMMNLHESSHADSFERVKRDIARGGRMTDHRFNPEAGAEVS